MSEVLIVANPPEVVFLTQEMFECVKFLQGHNITLQTKNGGPYVSLDPQNSVICSASHIHPDYHTALYKNQGSHIVRDKLYDLINPDLTCSNPQCPNQHCYGFTQNLSNEVLAYWVPLAEYEHVTLCHDCLKEIEEAHQAEGLTDWWVDMIQVPSKMWLYQTEEDFVIFITCPADESRTLASINPHTPKVISTNKQFIKLFIEQIGRVFGHSDLKVFSLFLTQSNKVG